MTSRAHLDTDRPRTPIEPTHLRLVPELPDHIAPHLDDLVCVVAQRVLEVESGRRPLQQLRRLLSPAVYTHLAYRQRRLAERARRSREPLPGPLPGAARALFGQSSPAGTYHATVLVRGRERTTAIAVAAERYQGRWRITEFTRPEDAGS